MKCLYYDINGKDPFMNSSSEKWAVVFYTFASKITYLPICVSHVICQFNKYIFWYNTLEYI